MSRSPAVSGSTGAERKLIAVLPVTSAVRAWLSVTLEYPRVVPSPHRAACHEPKAAEASSLPAVRTALAPSWQLAPIGVKLSGISIRFCQAVADNGDPAT